MCERKGSCILVLSSLGHLVKILIFYLSSMNIVCEIWESCNTVPKLSIQSTSDLSLIHIQGLGFWVLNIFLSMQNILSALFSVMRMERILNPLRLVPVFFHFVKCSSLNTFTLFTTFLCNIVFLQYIEIAYVKRLLTMMYKLAKKIVVMSEMGTEIKLTFQALISYRSPQTYKFKMKKCLVKQTSSNDRAASGHKLNRTHMSTEDNTDEGIIGFPPLKNGYDNSDTIPHTPEVCMHNSL